MPKVPPIQEPEDFPEDQAGPVRGANVAQTAIRNSPWVIIAIAIHAVIIAAMGMIYVQKHLKKEEAPPTSVAISKPKEETAPVIQPPEVIDRKAIPKNEEREVVSYEEDTSYIPSNEPMEEDLTLKRGDPNAISNLPSGGFSGGTGMGVGGVGHYGTGKPSPFSSRRAGTGGVGRRGGPSQATEQAVKEGLTWLLRHQNTDGSWSASSLKQLCKGGSNCYGGWQKLEDWYDEGLTGLALLAFLGAGYSYDSKQFVVDRVQAKKLYMGPAVKNGLTWLKNRQDGDGAFSRHKEKERDPFIYNEALATMAMCEAYGLSQNRFWKDSAQRGVNFLVNAQKPNPSGTGLWGWRYDSRADTEGKKAQKSIDEAAFQKLMRDADTSVTAWVVMALKSAELSGLEVPRSAFQGAMDFVKWVTNEKGQVGYMAPDGAGLPVTGSPNDHFKFYPTMAALGMCIRIFSEHNPQDPALDLAAKQLIQDLPADSADGLSLDYYYWYYATLALNQLDGPDSPRKTGKYWSPWNKAMQDAVIKTQSPESSTSNKQVCPLGGWIRPDKWGHEAGPIYSTAINVLTLEVYYRYENAFGVGEKKRK
jgi:hypothetical protein